MLDSKGIALEKENKRHLLGKEVWRGGSTRTDQCAIWILDKSRSHTPQTFKIHCLCICDPFLAWWLPSGLTAKQFSIVSVQKHHITRWGHCAGAVFDAFVPEDVCITEQDHSSPQTKGERGREGKSVCHTLYYGSWFSQLQRNIKHNSDDLSREIWLNYLYSPAERWNDEQPGIKLKT